MNDKIEETIGNKTTGRISESIFQSIEEKLNNLTNNVSLSSVDISSLQNQMERIVNEELANIKHKEEEGEDGLYYQNGMYPQNKDPNPAYAYGQGRGLYGNLGTYDDIVSGDSTFDKGINNIVTSLCTGRFEIDIDEYTDEDEIEQAKIEQEFLYKALFNPKGGWKKFIREWSESLKYGFSIWEVVFDKNGKVNKYAFRRANTVYQWIFDQEERELIAVKFMTLSGKNVLIDSKNLMIYSHEMTGTDFEGNAITRKVAGYLLIKKYLMKIHAAAMEFNATGVKVYKGEKDSSDNARVVNILSRSTAEKNAVLSIGAEESIEYISGQGQIPVVENMIRYYDEQIMKAFDNEGALLGLNQVGSYALATEASKKTAAASQYYGSLICELFNGNEPYNNIIETIIDSVFPNRTLQVYPKMVFKVAETSDLDIDKFQLYMNAGLPMTIDDINMLRKGLGMEPIISDNSSKVIKGIGSQEGQSQREPNQSFSNLLRLSETQHKASCNCGLSSDINLALNEEQEALRAYWAASEKVIGQQLYKLAPMLKQEFEKSLKEGMTYPEIEKLSLELFDKSLPIYKEQIKPLIRKAVLEGGASLLKEQGVIKKLPKIASIDKLSKTLSEEWVDYEAGRIATHNLNVVLGSLEEQSVKGIISGVIPKSLELPTETSMVKTAGQYVGSSFAYGRNESMMELKAESEKAGLKPMIAEYSSVLESNTCDPCKQADGTRVIVGSPEYLKISPPNLCLGRSRCRCIFSIIDEGEQGYDQILKELADGFSKAESTLLSNNVDLIFINDIKSSLLF